MALNLWLCVRITGFACSNSRVASCGARMTSHWMLHKNSKGGCGLNLRPCRAALVNLDFNVLYATVHDASTLCCSALQ